MRALKSILASAVLASAAVSGFPACADTQGRAQGVTRSYYATSVTIAMRDGTDLVANLVTPGHANPAPVIISITPYGRHAMHPIAANYAQAGFAFLAVDARGRGDSGGDFAMFYGDKTDTPDVIAWAAEQDFSNGDVAMWGASYGGYNQWMAATEGSPALNTITPAASVYPGLDFPMVVNTGYPYAAIWTGFTKGRDANFRLFSDSSYWRETFTDLLASGTPFSKTDEFVGFDTDLFDEWVSHPSLDSYWKGINPTDKEMSDVDLPILSVTGLYDGAQIGALAYYDQHMRTASKAARDKHYLIIGPYDHSGVHFPVAKLGGLDIPEAGGLQPLALMGEWYGWTMMGGPKPSFLQDNVMVYVMGEGANTWVSAPSVGALPVEKTRFSLSAQSESPTSIAAAGKLKDGKTSKSEVSYTFDPTDISKAHLGHWFEGDFIVNDRDVQAIDGEAFIFETAPMKTAAQIIGRAEFSAPISINTPDTDFQARLYVIEPDGRSIYIAETRQRARYRKSREKEALIKTEKMLRYDFEPFSFAARHLPKGSKLRLVVGAPNSIYIQRNYNGAGPVADQTPADALPVTVRMSLGGKRGASLTVPMRVMKGDS